MNRRSLFRTAFGGLALPFLKIEPGQTEAMPPRADSSFTIRPQDSDERIRIEVVGGGGSSGRGGSGAVLIVSSKSIKPGVPVVVC